MHLLRCLSFFVAHLNIYITATHLTGVISVTDDHLSHGRLNQAFQVTPTSSYQSTVILHTAFQLISPRRFDWISPHFL